MATADRIEREVHIDAPVERVWGLVTEPGWWIGDGAEAGRSTRRDGEFEVVEHPRYGSFPVRVEAVEPQHFVSFRWASTHPGREPGEGNSTLVEFRLSEHEGGTLLRVVERGFDSLDVSEPDRAQAVEANTGGWGQQLGVIKGNAERVGA